VSALTTARRTGSKANHGLGCSACRARTWDGLGVGMARSVAGKPDWVNLRLFLETTAKYL
jgi:hypothetical protein